MKTFRFRDIIILGLMNFALFVGAGNIIFPPFIGYMAGHNVWIAGIGFLLTGVGLPVITSIAMARVGGYLPEITKPLGKYAGNILIIVCYLCVGPLFATPRTATVSYDLGFKPFLHTENYLWIYSLVFFIIVIAVSLYPQKLFETVGKCLSPIKVAALIILCVTVFILPVGAPAEPQLAYATIPFSEGISQGYLTMDTLASLVFGIVIVGAIHSRGVSAPHLVTRYAIYSGIIAGLMLCIIYVSLFRLGTNSASLIQNAGNGAEILSAYVNHTYGIGGDIFLSLLITIACLVTAIGLTSSGGSYFSSLTGINYKILVVIFGILSMLVSNIGLTQLIAISIPAMEVIYPIFVVLVAISFFKKIFKSASIIAVPTSILALAFGIAEALKGAKMAKLLPDFYSHIWFEKQGLAWVIPCLIVIGIFAIIDAIFSPNKHKTSQLSNLIK